MHPDLRRGAFKRDLIACRLVARDWSVAALSALFEDVSFEWVESKCSVATVLSREEVLLYTKHTSLAALVDFLHSSPAICNAIQRLTLVYSSSRVPKRNAHTNACYDRFPRTSAKLVHTILDLLPRLTHVRLSGIRLDSRLPRPLDSHRTIRSLEICSQARPRGDPSARIQRDAPLSSRLRAISAVFELLETVLGLIDLFSVVDIVRIYTYFMRRPQRTDQDVPTTTLLKSLVLRTPCLPAQACHFQADIIFDALQNLMNTSQLESLDFSRAYVGAGNELFVAAWRVFLSSTVGTRLKKIGIQASRNETGECSSVRLLMYFSLFAPLFRS